jgi:tetratricopeptide (TPR) repeat protein
MTYGRTKEWALSVEHLAKATELDPENRPYHRYLGFALARAGRNDEAVAAFTRYEGEAKAHYYLAEMLEHLGQVEECKMQLVLALAKDPQLGDATRMMVRLNNPVPTTGASAVAPAQSGIQTVGFTAPVERIQPTLPPPPPPMRPLSE